MKTKLSIIFLFISACTYSQYPVNATYVKVSDRVQFSDNSKMYKFDTSAMLSTKPYVRTILKDTAAVLRSEYNGKLATKLAKSDTVSIVATKTALNDSINAVQASLTSYMRKSDSSYMASKNYVDNRNAVQTAIFDDSLAAVRADFPTGGGGVAGFTQANNKPWGSQKSWVSIDTSNTDPTNTQIVNLNGSLRPTNISLINSSDGIGSYITNSSDGTGSHITNSSIGTGSNISNRSTGIGSYISNISTGTGSYISNSSTGTGSNTTNSSTGNGSYISNSSTGTGSYITNSSTGNGSYIGNSSDGNGSYISNSSDGTGSHIYNNDIGDAFKINNLSTGVPFKIQHNGSNKNILNPSVADGASAVAYTFDTQNNLTTTGAKLMSFKEAGVEYANFDNDGMLRLSNPVWDDILVDVTTLKQVGTADKPDFDATNLGLLFPDNDTTEMVGHIYQMPHKVKEGSITIYPHVHLRQTTADTCIMKIAYRYYQIGGAIPTTWTVLTTNSKAATWSGGSIHQIVGFPGITITNSLSGILDVKLYRSPADAITGDVLVKQFDIHVPINKLGSKNPLTD